jgi:ABC-type multidrug transport system fused ATPase/permease subunit
LPINYVRRVEGRGTKMEKGKENSLVQISRWMNILRWFILIILLSLGTTVVFLAGPLTFLGLAALVGTLLSFVAVYYFFQRVSNLMVLRSKESLLLDERRIAEISALFEMSQSLLRCSTVLEAVGVLENFLGRLVEH